MVPASVSLEFFRFLTELEKKKERKSPQGVGKPFPCPTASYPGCHWADSALDGGEASRMTAPTSIQITEKAAAAQLYRRWCLYMFMKMSRSILKELCRAFNTSFDRAA